VTAPRVLSHIAPERLSAVRDAHPDVAITAVPQEGEPPPDVRGEVLLTLPWGTPNLAALLERGVAWVHAIGTGVDRFPFHLLGGRTLTCSRGASAVPIAEWVLAMLLAAEKRLPESWIAAPPARWSQASLGRLEGKVLGLVGLGGIGGAVAIRARAFGMRVRALRRTPRAAAIAGVEIAADLGDLLQSADHLVLAAPATPETRHLLDAAAFARVKHGVHLVNVSRGALVDMDALRDALDRGAVSRASLDTVEPEPLPAGHWAYAHPAVRLSPHISWSMDGAFDLLVASFVDNLARHRRGAPLEGVVDPAAGY
jgi:phosphoglycerate dehydrogenase-like enzyme